MSLSVNVFVIAYPLNQLRHYTPWNIKKNVSRYNEINMCECIWISRNCMWKQWSSPLRYLLYKTANFCQKLALSLLQKRHPCANINFRNGKPLSWLQMLVDSYCRFAMCYDGHNGHDMGPLWMNIEYKMPCLYHSYSCQNDISGWI